MKPKGVVLIIPATALVVASVASTAEAYRPFDGTDAAVADHGQIEVELGVPEYLREAAAHTLIAPSLRLNYGFAPAWEAVLEGEVAHGLSGGIGGTRLTGTGVFLKTVLREGVLQDKAGPSVATEFGLLLPGIRDEHGTGASLAGSVSERREWGTLHINAAAAVTREQHADLFIGLIAEGPHDWVVRPVAEVFYDRNIGSSQTRSALVGAIWQLKEDVAIDIGFRGARVNEHTAGEIRAGLTFAFGALR